MEFGWDGEPESIPGAPRRVGWRLCLGPTGWFLPLFGGIWLVAGVSVALGFLIFGGNPWEDVILDERHVEATGIPTEASETSSSVNGKRVHRILVGFHDSSGIPWEVRSHTTDANLIGAARAGRSITIEYDPDLPERARIQGTRRSIFGFWVLIPVAAALVGAVLLGYAGREAWRRRHVLMHGQPAQARIVLVRPTWMYINRRRVFEVHYAFASMRGEILGRARVLEPPEPDSESTVLYDLGDPSRNVILLPHL